MRFNTKYLPYLAALFQAFQFAHAGSVYFGLPGWVIGACGGVVINLSVAIAGTRVSDIAIKRRPLAYATLGLLLILSPIAVAPAAYVSMTAITSDALRWIVAAVWAALPDLSILLTGAIAGKSLVKDGEVTGKKQQPVRKKAKVARNRIDEPVLLAYLQANAGASQREVAEHFGVTRQAIGARIKTLYPAIPPKGTQS